MQKGIETVKVVPISVTATTKNTILKSSPQSSSAMRNSSEIKWSDIDQVRFFTVGTFLYTGITICLHPVGVIKTRLQVLNKEAVSVGVNGTANQVSGAVSPSSLQQHQHLKSPTVTSIVRNMLKSNVTVQSRIKGFYRGMGIVLALAIPTRVIYISTLETTKETAGNILNQQIKNLPEFITNNSNITRSSSSIVAALSGGIAGGVAAMSAQLLVVPMDVISQRQMVMNDVQYAQYGGPLRTIRSILQSDAGWKGLYRGFGLSLFTSLPSGMIWWGCYSGCQHTLNSMKFFQNIELQQQYQDEMGVVDSTRTTVHYSSLAKRGLMQLISGLSAAVVAATLTQPLDVVKTRIQVARKEQETYTSVVRDLVEKTGYRGFFRGTGPRIIQMGLWGTVMSSAYEYLRYVSLKEM